MVKNEIQLLNIPIPPDVLIGLALFAPRFVS
jgi:hypothetical protein